jgi:hypothetical protein
MLLAMVGRQDASAGHDASPLSKRAAEKVRFRFPTHSTCFGERPKQQQRQRPTSNLMAWRAGFTSIIPTDPSHEKSASAGLHFSCNWALELSGSFSEKGKRRTLSPALAVSTPIGAGRPFFVGFFLLRAGVAEPG